MSRRSTTTRDRHRKRQPPRRCAQCGATGTPLQQDHIINLAAGGPDVVANMCWLCIPCHEAKTERERQAGRDKARQQRGGLSKRRRELEPHPITKAISNTVYASDQG